jgi:ParB family transcriptional regulator, chromosome partitioning protein
VNLRMRHDLHFVEQLVSREGAPIGRMVPIEQIEPNPKQPRVDVGDLTELEASIREKGILEPLLVKRLQHGRFMIISGERRFRAAKLVGLRDVPCIELDVDEATCAEIALIENLQRKDLTAFEEAEGLKSLVERFGYTHQEIAERIGKSRPSVTEALSIAALPGEIQEACRRADIVSKSMLLQVVRQPDDAAMRRLIDRVASEGVGRDALRRERRDRRREPVRKPLVFRFQGGDFALEIRFRRSRVPREQIADRLEDVARHLRSEK